MNEWTLPAERARRLRRTGRAGESSRAATSATSRSCAAASGATSSAATANPTGCTSACWRSRTRLHALPPATRTSAMTELLYRGQANDAYWHGLFGGLYLPHLRRAVWNALVELEAEIDAVQPRPLLRLGRHRPGRSRGAVPARLQRCRSWCATTPKRP